ncbi:transcription regulator, ArsR family [Streptococcus constellatus subsp. pharyngis SK1060 = CCUG 46377]|uniref:Transcription regulator, ArsR family n=1 Tax=Streptococcus constellatus subsp. pharyngis SK1060 = CCUG 46377 TaxID=1035184 RepID=F9P4T9_STRCV|nr:transcription regulator, ArsR family [Streptococcus constellatus subsp. pharyngis SK1060 = CCUG 46377]
MILETRQKNYIYYELNTSVLEDIVVWLAELKGDKTNED